MGRRCSGNGIIIFFQSFPINKKSKRVLNGFNEIIGEFNRQPNKLWVDQGREFCNKLMQEWLHNNDFLMTSTYNEGKSVIPERFIKPLKAKSIQK